jgi:hypothetical protein
VPNFIRVGGLFLNVDQIVEVQDLSDGDGGSCHVWLTSGRNHGFKGSDASTLLDAMAKQTSGMDALLDRLPLP